MKVNEIMIKTLAGCQALARSVLGYNSLISLWGELLRFFPHPSRSGNAKDSTNEFLVAKLKLLVE